MSRLPGGIGAEGSAQSRFFHPRQHIREKCPNDHMTKRVLEVSLAGKETHRVNWKDQLCYEFRIPEILTTEPSSTFAVATLGLKNPHLTTFEYEIVGMTVVAAPQDPERERTTALRDSVVDFVVNVNGGLLQEIAKLRHQGIDMDDKNEPSPENAYPSAPATQTIGRWVSPTICPRRADVNCYNTKGV